MYLKDFPRDVAVDALVDMLMTMTQTTLLRVYEIIELEKQSLTDEERKALDDLVSLQRIAGLDIRKLKRRMAH